MSKGALKFQGLLNLSFWVKKSRKRFRPYASPEFCIYLYWSFNNFVKKSAYFLWPLLLK